MPAISTLKVLSDWPGAGDAASTPKGITNAAEAGCGKCTTCVRVGNMPTTTIPVNVAVLPG